MQLTWDDEFNGTSIDTSKWTFQTGGGGWGNGELEYYTDPATKVGQPNAYVSNGVLHIDAIKENYGGSTWTSARMNCTFSQTYGVFEIRAALPYGQGLWPAFWMMPQTNTYGGWPNSGEIDVMESHGQNLNDVWGTLHFGNPGTQTYLDRGDPTQSNDPYVLTSPQHNTTDWHTYAVDWEPGDIRLYVDGYCYADFNGTSGVSGDGTGPAWWVGNNPATFPEPFNQPFYVLLNLAVGGAGSWGGAPDATTPALDEMLVDYVRIYQDPALMGGTTPEPATLTLLVLGGAATLRRRRRRAAKR